MVAVYTIYKDEMKGTYEVRITNREYWCMVAKNGGQRGSCARDSPSARRA